MNVEKLVWALSTSAREADCAQQAEWHLLEMEFRARLDDAGIQAGPDAAATLMAAAVFLAQHVPEWGGDARDSLADLAHLGLRLLEDADGAG